MLIDHFTDYCIQHNIVTTEDIPLLHYCLEKRIYTILISLPVFFIGFILSDPFMMISFLGSFYYLRSITNGFHSRTVIGCFIGSIALEYFLLRWAAPNLTLTVAIILFCLSSVIILSYAPYNHPDMSLSDKEITICRIIAKKRLIIITAIIISASAISAPKIVKGISLGITLVATLLCLAYINEWRKKYAQRKRKESRECD